MRKRDVSELLFFVDTGGGIIMMMTEKERRLEDLFVDDAHLIVRGVSLLQSL